MSFSGEISGVFFFDPADKIYNEHFKGNPVVPGSIIINAFVDILKKHKTDLADYKVENFRFKKFISPGEYEFNITFDSPDYFCRIIMNDKVAVSGVIRI